MHDNVLENRIEQIEKRCEKLARQNRWLRTILLASPVVFLAAAGQNSGREITAQSIVTQSLTVQDSKGKVRATLEAERGPVLTLLNANGEPAIRLKAGDGGVNSLSVQYHNGKSAFAMVAQKDLPTFGMRNSNNGRFLLHMGKLNPKMGTLDIYNASGERTNSFGGE